MVGAILPVFLFGAILVLSPLTKPAMLGHVIKALGGNWDAWSASAQYGAYAVSAALLGFMLLNFGAIISGTTVWWEMRVAPACRAASATTAWAPAASSSGSRTR